MSCQHSEDVFCQYCIEKVQREEAPPSPKKKKTMTLGEKRNKILIDSAFLAAFGYVAYYNTKFFIKTSVELFRFISGGIDKILETITTREE